MQTFNAFKPRIAVIRSGGPGVFLLLAVLLPLVVLALVIFALFMLVRAFVPALPRRRPRTEAEILAQAQARAARPPRNAGNTSAPLPVIDAEYTTVE